MCYYGWLFRLLRFRCIFCELRVLLFTVDMWPTFTVELGDNVNNAKQRIQNIYRRPELCYS